MNRDWMRRCIRLKKFEHFDIEFKEELSGIDSRLLHFAEVNDDTG